MRKETLFGPWGTENSLLTSIQETILPEGWFVERVKFFMATSFEQGKQFLNPFVVKLGRPLDNGSDFLPKLGRSFPMLKVDLVVVVFFDLIDRDRVGDITE